MTHRNASLTVEGIRRLIERCQSRPIAHVAAEVVTNVLPYAPRPGNY